MVTRIPMANRGNAGTASNTVAATTLSITVSANSTSPNSLFVMAIAIYTAGVTVSSVAGGGMQSPWTFQGGKTDSVSGVRVEMWTVPVFEGGSGAAATITFSSAALASACISSYTEPYDYPSAPFVNCNANLLNTSGVTSGTHVETLVLAGQPVTAGNLLIFSVLQSGSFLGLPISSVTDSLGTTYTLVNTAAAGSGNTYTAVYAGLAGASAAAYPGAVITVHWSGSSAIQKYVLSQWSGVTATTDVGTAYGTQSNGVYTTNITTTNANDLIHFVAGYYGGQIAYLSQYPGYVYTNGNPGYLYESGRIVTAAGTYPTYWVNNNTTSICITAFKVSPTYTPTAPPVPNTATGQGAGSYYAELDLTPQTGGSMIVTAFAVATSSGDTFANQRNSVTPTVTSAAAVLVDAGPENILTQMRTQLRMSAQRNWAAFSFELVAGNTSASTGSALPVKSSSAGLTCMPKYQLKSGWNVEAFKVAASHQAVGGSSLSVFAQALASATLGVAYSETIFANGGFSPYALSVIGSLPPGLSLNSGTGVISGTPTTIGTYSFTIRAVDSLLNTATGAFQIMTVASTNSGFVN